MDNLRASQPQRPLLLAPITRLGKREDYMTTLQFRRRNFLIGIAVFILATSSLGVFVQAQEVLKIGVLGVMSGPLLPGVS